MKNGLKYFGMICWVLSIRCTERKIDAKAVTANCRGMEALTEIQKAQICPFYDDYREALNNKNAEKLLSYIGNLYRGSDGMNAQSLRTAMMNEIQNMPWSEVRFIEFQVTKLVDRIEIEHQMQAAISHGTKNLVREKLSWSLESNKKWRIVNWQHKK